MAWGGARSGSGPKKKERVSLAVSKGMAAELRADALNKARRMNKTVAAISPETMDSLTHYSWPGNIREVQNVIERSVVVYRKGNFSVKKSALSG
jgi:transcriptional regulator with GAF, ATPase, and Fis domain